MGGSWATRNTTQKKWRLLYRPEDRRDVDSKCMTGRGKSFFMIRRKERSKRWVQSGRFAVEIEVIYPDDSLDDSCLEPATVKWLDEVSRHAELRI